MRSLMKPLLQRNYLSENVETALRDAIAKNKFGEFMPGERRLAELMGVSRPTLRVALAALTKEGVIAPHQGRRTKVLIRPVSAKSLRAQKTNRVSFLSRSPLHALTPDTLLILDLLRANLEERGIKLEYRQCHAFSQQNPEYALTKLVTEDPADAYLLHQAPVTAQCWFSTHQHPAIVVGTPEEDSRLEGVDTDFRPTARHAVGQLSAAGHSVDAIGLLIPELNLPGNRAIITGFYEAGGQPARVFRHPGDYGEFITWMQSWSPLSGPLPCTGLIIAWPAATLALMGKLGIRQSKRIPEALSLICLADDSALGMIIPPVTRYKRSPERYVATLSRLIIRATKGMSDPDGQLHGLMPELIKGETICPPAHA